MQILNNTIVDPSIFRRLLPRRWYDELPKLEELYGLISLREKGLLRLLLFIFQHAGREIHITLFMPKRSLKCCWKMTPTHLDILYVMHCVLSNQGSWLEVINHICILILDSAFSRTPFSLLFFGNFKVGKLSTIKRWEFRQVPEIYDIGIINHGWYYYFCCISPTLPCDPPT